MRIHISLVCSVRNSTNGLSLCDSGLLVYVDGKLKSVLKHKDGFVMFKDITAGHHDLIFKYPGFNDEYLSVDIDENETLYEAVTLRPKAVYGNNLCKVKITKLDPNSQIYVSNTMLCLSIQQQECESGTKDIRLFKKTNTVIIAPLKVLCADKKNPEIAILFDKLSPEIWRLTKPLSFSHKRGEKFYPTQSYVADEEGTVTVTLFKEGTIEALYKGKLYEFEAKSGDNIWQIQ